MATPRQVTVTHLRSGRPIYTMAGVTAPSTVASGAPEPATATSSGSAPPWVPNHFLAGAAAGVVAAVATCPLEVLKTRMQAAPVGFTRSAVHVTGTTASVASPGGFMSSLLHPTRFVLREIRGIAKREGVRGLWRGIIPQVLGVAPARAVYFQTYDMGRNALAANGMHGSLLHLAAASGAGMTVATVLSPVWVIKTRLQIQTNVDAIGRDGKAIRNYTGAWDAFTGIIREEGVRGLYRGLSASYLGVTEGAAHFMMYQGLKTEAKERGFTVTPFWSFCMAAVCKLVASAATYPHEVIRTRLRDRVAMSDPDGPRYRGLVHAFRRVAEEEGVRGLYAGMGPHLLRVVPNAALLFCVMEVLLGGQI